LTKKDEINNISLYMVGPSGFLGLLEANDGSIWVGAGNGIYRYNGRTITDFKSKESQK
jgi:ligand-binding sensor domain-containing protein